MSIDYFHRVKKHSILWLIAIFWLLNHSARAQVHCDGDRYINQVFTEIDSTIEVKYGENYTANGTFRELKFNIYYPKQEFFFDRPLIILAHGGSFIAGNKRDMRLLCEEFAHRGYVCATVDYRLQDDFSQPIDSILVLDVVTKAVSDLRAAVRWFKENASTTDDFGIDTNFIFLGGASAGAIASMQCAFYDKDDSVSPTLDSVIQANGGYQGNSSTNLTYNSEVTGVLNYSGALKGISILDASDPPVFGAHDDGDPTVPYGTAYTTELGTPILVDGSRTIHDRATELGIRNQLVTIKNSNGHVSYFLDGPNTAKYKNVIDSTCRFLEYIICDRALNISQAAAKSIKVFPNPSEGTITLDGIGISTLYQVFDLNGQLLLQGQLSADKTLKLVDFIPGVYQLCLSENGQSTISKKIFVQ
jgi:para-nitrobenzyl esterase